jgi:hypothetical protein
MKTVIQVYKQSIKKHNADGENVNTIIGLGDCIRGSYTLYKLSKIYNFNLIIDIRHHPISKFLKINEHQYNNLVNENINELKFFFYSNNLIDYILNSFQKNDIVFLHTNSIYDENDIYSQNTVNVLLEDEQIFLKNLFIPNDNFNNYICNKLNNLNNFTIIHFRIGDKSFNNSNLCIDELKILENIFKNNYNDNDVLISDNEYFKKYIKSKYNINIFETSIGHIGYVNSNDNIIQDTLFDFFLISKSNKIKAYNTYEWISGFIHWTSKAYNIPLKLIK